MALKILAFDGGGVRGALSAAIWVELVEDNPRILDSFHCLTGTSAGGLIAGLVAAGVGAQDILEVYNSKSKEVFQTSPLSTLGVLQSRYSSSGLKTLIESLVGKREFGSVEKRLLITASNISAGTPYTFDSHNQAHRSIPLVDVLLATSAAPSYFDPVEINGSTYADGGMWAIDPSLNAVLFLHAEGVKFETMRLVNVGTGQTEHLYQERLQKNQNWGMVGEWKGARLLGLFENLQNNFSKSAIETLLTKEHRIDVDVKLKHYIEIDDQKSLPELNELPRSKLRGIREQVLLF